MKGLTNYITSTHLDRVIPVEKRGNSHLVYIKDHTGKVSVAPRFDLRHPLIFKELRSAGLDIVETSVYDLSTLMDLLPDYTLEKQGKEYKLHLDEQFTNKVFSGNNLLNVVAVAVYNIYKK